MGEQVVTVGQFDQRDNNVQLSRLSAWNKLQADRFAGNKR